MKKPVNDDSCVAVIPKPITKIELIKFKLQKPRIVNIDNNLKRIYSIKN